MWMLWKLLFSIDDGDSGKWNLCGHSMGGGTAEAMALLEPQRTHTLTIANGMVF
jgi:pimeloyl-ACP methyl ester carboxylesterase